MARAEPPSARIVAEIRRRIATAQLRAGDRVPSARQITQEWGVAIATATKALGTLRQEGLVRAVPGVGTVVAEPAARPAAVADPVAGGAAVPVRPTRRRDAGSDADAARARIAAAAVQIADAEGMAALSMRRVAAELGLATMSLYRYVQSKEELVLLMIDQVFTEELPPEPPPAYWRPRLELLARLQWSMSRRHPWAARVISFTRPQLAPNAMVHTEWALAALDGLGLDPATALHIVLTLTGLVVGTAVNLELEREAEQESGVTSSEWMEEQDPAFHAIVQSGRFPQLAKLASVPDFDMDLDRLFEFALARMLDGIAVFLDRPGP